MVKILVPTDYSSCSIAALKYALGLARGSNGALVVLHVVESGSSGEASHLSQHERLHQDIDLLLASFNSPDHPLQYEERIVNGPAVTTILSVAEQEAVDLIIMGTTGRRGLNRVVMGSVTEAVCRRAKCPVLTLKANQPTPDAETTDDLWNRLTTLNTSVPPSKTVDVLTAAEINDNPILALLSRGIAMRATDVHIDPTTEDFSVRFRIDGRLVGYCRLSREVGHALITQLKVAANLDIADPFHPQEGRLQLPASLMEYEVRVTSVRVVDGEAISLRVLSRELLMRPMDQLGLSPEAHSAIEQILKHGEGLILVTGPTGSGKTTTLYSMLRSIDDGSRNIVSIEDPVEYDIPSFRQLPVDLKHGMTMTNGLRTLLRLDPDVVFVGEIRDGETAETAMRAASSGKYVFSSLHTRDVAATVTALRDLHVDNCSLAGNLAGIISQRLLRRLCSNCKQHSEITEQEKAIFVVNGVEPPANVYHACGCDQCRNSGYAGRVGVFEIISCNSGIMSAIEEGDTEDELRNLMALHGICSMRRDALQKVAAGITSLEEMSSMTEIVPTNVFKESLAIRYERRDSADALLSTSTVVEP